VNVDRARELLTAELTELDEQTRAAEADADADGGDGAAGPLSQHPGDYGTDVAGTMDAELLAETRATQRRHLQQALDRLDEGSYGSCLVCGATIDDERLEARPEAATCREHADTPVGA
jgi:RNA polymerase-binding transcription factor DksA